MVQASDNFSENELSRPDKVMILKIVEVLGVVNIVNFELQSLLLLKQIVDWYRSHPSWIQGVGNNFGLTDSLPLITRLNIQYQKWIGLGANVEIRQLLPLKR